MGVSTGITNKAISIVEDSKAIWQVSPSKLWVEVRGAWLMTPWVGGMARKVIIDTMGKRSDPQGNQQRAR